MGIPLSGLNGLASPLRSLIGWLAHASGPQRAVRRARLGNRDAAAPAASSGRTGRPVRPDPRARRPLRVVRVVDASRPAAGAGRMFISGRMADVCAELDRLAAMEAAAG